MEPANATQRAMQFHALIPPLQPQPSSLSTDAEIIFCHANAVDRAVIPDTPVERERTADAFRKYVVLLQLGIDAKLVEERSPRAHSLSMRQGFIQQ